MPNPTGYGCCLCPLQTLQIYIELCKLVKLVKICKVLYIYNILFKLNLVYNSYRLIISLLYTLVYNLSSSFFTWQKCNSGVYYKYSPGGFNTHITGIINYIILYSYIKLCHDLTGLFLCPCVRQVTGWHSNWLI